MDGFWQLLVGLKMPKGKRGPEWSLVLEQWLPGSDFKAPLATEILESELVGAAMSMMLPLISRPAGTRDLDPAGCTLIPRGSPVYLPGGIPGQGTSF